MTWRDLTDELDAWGAAGHVASLWWRDDDAIEPTAALDRLLDLAAERGVPLALAVIPARATEALVRRITDGPSRPSVLQHGFAHRNHAPAGDKKVELGAHRPADTVIEELATGQARMDVLFETDREPVLVPPWNRIADALIPGVVQLGFTGLSTYEARSAPSPVSGLVQVNCHVDIMRWDQPRGFLGGSQALALLIGHLRARRLGAADRDEATGLLSHHLVHDEACWDFLERLLDQLTRHPAARLMSARDAFAGRADLTGTRGAA